MAMELRPYQRELLQQVQKALASNPEVRLMMQLPTGGGKTIIAGALLKDRLADGRRKAVWLTHRKELAEQTCGMLTNAGVSAITDVNWTPGEGAPAMAGGVVILMAQKVSLQTARREVWNRYRPTDLMIVDEAHHAAAKGWERAIRQWRGLVVGMTATPWRLSEKEGFDHILDKLHCGPQVAELQAQGYLCAAQVLMPPPEQRIIGGAVDLTGDYTESGIKQANRDRPNIMTAGALQFWREHASDRQTIAYAVSKEHARNLTSVFNNAGVKAAVILSGIDPRERDTAISGFKEGRVKVLVNVLIATEGFDLPDASCILIARPTMSLAIYLQMVGRGLRPKPDDGDCIILDLAGNSVTHSLPEENREWSLEPRGKQGEGKEAPVVWCEKCLTASHAASHHCRQCGEPFGKDCKRCGKWRAWKRWEYEHHCGDKHQRVCDLCHIDAHIQAHLPVEPPLDKLVDICDDGEAMDNDFEIDGDMADRLEALFRELLETEREAIVGRDDARRRELAQLIEERESVLKDNAKQYALFKKHIGDLPESERPVGPIQEAQMLVKYVAGLHSELANWREERAELESRPVNKQAIFNSARIKAMHLLQKAAKDIIDWPPGQNGGKKTNGHDPVNGNWHKLSELGNTFPLKKGLKPSALRFPNGNEKIVRSWKEMYVSVVEWSFDEKLLRPDAIPWKLKSPTCIRSKGQYDPTGFWKTVKLKNGLFLYVHWGKEQMLGKIRRFIRECGKDPSQFHGQLPEDFS